VTGAGRRVFPRTRAGRQLARQYAVDALSGWAAIAGGPARAAPRSAGLGSRRERAARAHQSSAAAAGSLVREGPHACCCACSLGLAAAASAGARFLRPGGGRLGRARAARRARAPGGARRRGLPARDAAGQGPRPRHRHRCRSAVARPRVSAGAGHGPRHLGGDDRAGAGEAARRVVGARRVLGRRRAAAALRGRLVRAGGPDQRARVLRRDSAPARARRLRGRGQQPWAKDAVPHARTDTAQRLPPPWGRGRRRRGGGSGHVLRGQTRLSLPPKSSRAR
jgi:hypothetical protein